MSLVAKAGGFILVPGILSRIALPRVVKEQDTFNQASMKGAVTYAAIAAASYYGTKHLPPALTEFAEGATWGAGIAAAALALAPLYTPKDKQDSTLQIYKRSLGIPALPAPKVSGVEPSGAERLIAALTGH